MKNIINLVSAELAKRQVISKICVPKKNSINFCICASQGNSNEYQHCAFIKKTSKKSQHH